MFYFSPMYLVFALPALLLAFYAQIKVKSAYSKYSQQPNWGGISGLEAARRLLSASGLSHINIEGVPGQLSDHYDPRSKTLRLSPQVAHGQTVAALAIVAHEIGHANQDAQGYTPLRLRAGLVPMVTVGAWVGPVLFFLGLFLRMTGLAWLGLLAFAGAAIFALVTLPVELNASRRGQEMLRRYNLVDEREMKGVKSVLSAASLTYVAALAQTLSTLLYYTFLLSGTSRDD
jgi:Zn-dependent membrane protease YugP